MDYSKDLLALKEIAASGTLRFFGCWFGRPYDNFHRVQSVQFEDDVLCVGFDQNEHLEVWRPIGYYINKQATSRSKPILTISKASKVIWKWYLYGRPKTKENLITLEYGFHENQIYAKSSSVQSSAGAPDPSENAVELI